MNPIQQLTRWHGVLIALVGGAVLGLLLGLVVGWSWWPVEWANATPGNLRSDFQGDYVFWVAERYAVTGDLEWARRRLGVEHWREGQLAEALERVAQERGRSEAACVRALAQALETVPATTSAAGVWGMRRPAVALCVVMFLEMALVWVAFLPAGRWRSSGEGSKHRGHIEYGKVSAGQQLIRRRGGLIALAGGAVLGLLLGLVVGWSWWPVEWTNATPGNLHSDFQDEYVLWVAERYAATDDLGWACRRLGATYWQEGQLAETLGRLAQGRGGSEAAQVRALAWAFETAPEVASSASRVGVWGMRRLVMPVGVCILLGVVFVGVTLLPIKRLRGAQLVLRRVGVSLVTLLVIAWLTLFGLIMAERGREGLPAEPVSAAGEALLRTVTYLTDHPRIYYWNTYEFSALGFVATTFGRSAGLLLASLGLATALGVPLGIGAALARRKGSASLVLLLSILGVSTPSFLLAMLFWVVDFGLHRKLGIPALPPTGFGWDAHLVMPALVLAARPLAQIAQVTYVSMSEVLGEDYIRTAWAKGLHWRVVRNRHALRNVLIPILTTVGTSLRFSLASLPVVEYFFVWPGVGLALLEAIELGMTPLVTDLIVSLGLLFLLINLALEVIYPLLDPRLRNGGQEEALRERRSWREALRGLADGVVEWFADLRRLLPGARREERRLHPLPVDVQSTDPPENNSHSHASTPSHSRWVLRSTLRNSALLVGLLLVLSFFGLALLGERLTEANPYEVHGTMIIEGEIGAPPFVPSTVFPWGTDHIGRDVQALVLTGAKRTLALALFGMVARVLVGMVLGMVAGWWQGSWLDRLVTGAVGVWAAFPYTLFAMIVIQALGIQQGMWVFVVALCVVGWGEVAQFVRGQVMGIKPRLYIEAARALGARSTRILARHVVPNLLAALLVLAVLEMGGVLMLLSELGFLNIFLGGGYRVQIAEYGSMVPVMAYFSDVPEWGALLANIRGWWRSYPWMAWYPGVAFFLAIVAFNVWGEGLRRFLLESRVNVSRLFNRYTLLVAGVLMLGLVWVLQSTAPLGVYRSQARQFDVQRAMEDIRVLASPELQGRETGTPGADLAVEYIARRMKEIGLDPGGQSGTYMLSVEKSSYHLTQTPRLEILDDQGSVVEAFTYYQDFIVCAGSYNLSGESEHAIVGLALGPLPDTSSAGDQYGLRNYDVWDKVVLVREADLDHVNVEAVAGILIVSDDPLRFQRKYLFHLSYVQQTPGMYITPEVAERLLATAGSSLEELDRLAAGLKPGEIGLTAPGVTVHLETVLEGNFDFDWERIAQAEYGIHSTVVGIIPGTGSSMQVAPGKPLSNQVIIVSAYYDGLGFGLNGEFYPGANDNASGVATMLEMARVLKEGPYPPKRTIIFIAWPDGERYESLSVSDVMSSRPSLRALNVEAVIELSGIGAGVGQEIALGQGTSYRLAQLFQNAADRVGSSVTTRGRGPHYGMWTRMGFGGRSALSAYVSWDGSDRTAHMVEDTFEAIDPEKLEQVGQTTLLVLTVLGRELEY